MVCIQSMDTNSLCIVSIIINDMHDASDVGTIGHMLSFGVGRTAIIQNVLKNGFLSVFCTASK